MARSENFAILIPTFNRDDGDRDGWGRRGGYYSWYGRFRDGHDYGHYGRFYRGDDHGHFGHWGRWGRGGHD